MKRAALTELHQQFTCPECGGHTFGTMNHWQVPSDKWIRECHGWKDGARCKFEWPIADDERYIK